MLAVASLAALAVSVQQVAAHGGVLYYSNGGNWYKGFTPYNTPVGQVTIQRPWNAYDPILDATAPTVSCNDDGSSLPAGQQLTATVAAGSSITAYWNDPWPHPTGPMLTYLAQCPGSTCTGVNSNTLRWFKIDEAGLLSGTVATGLWASGKMVADNNTWTSTIPASVPNGQYLIRFETIALHSMPAQLYPECAQIEIVGGGSRAPTAAELVTFPGGYRNTDPGLVVDLYGQAAQTQTTYIIPGPPLYGSGGSGGSNPVPTTAAPGTTAVPTTAAPPPAPPPAPTAPAGTVAQYGQCGGQTYSGPTGCVAPYTCTVLNPYYSQCL